MKKMCFTTLIVVPTTNSKNISTIIHTTKTAVNIPANIPDIFATNPMIIVKTITSKKIKNPKLNIFIQKFQINDKNPIVF